MIHLPQIRARVAAEHFARIRRDLRENGLTLRSEDGDCIRQVNFTMLVFGFHMRKSGPKFVYGKAINTRIDFVEFALFGFELRVFDNGRHAVLRFAQDAAVTGGVRDDCRKNRRRRVARTMRGDQRLQRFRPNERRIARNNDGDLCISDRPPGNKHRVTGAVLRLLQNGFDVERLDRFRNLLCLMADHGNNPFRRKRQTSTHNTFHERASASRMKDFRDRRFEPCTLPRGENHNHNIFVRHSWGILARPLRFDN